MKQSSLTEFAALDCRVASLLAMTGRGRNALIVRNDGSYVSKSWRALFDVGAHRFGLVGLPHQRHLLDGFG
jgi:hypothetical protein